MRILQINVVSDFGSTGRNVIEVSRMLDARGHEMYLAYGHGSSSWPNSHKIGSKLENHMHNITARISGKHGYGSRSGTLELIRYIKTVKPDVIHLGTLHMFFINIEILFTFLKDYDKPVVWTLHDCWSFTGRCPHYTTIQCDKWKTQCNAPCPEAKRYPSSLLFDKTEQMFIDKKKWFLSIDKLHLVTVSNWLKEQAGLSFFSPRPIQTIYNWIDHGTFKPSIVPQDTYDKWKVSPHQNLIISVAGNWQGSKWDDALKLAKKFPDDSYLLLVGDMPTTNDLPSNIVHIPYVSEIDDLVILYNMADVYVHFSLEDTFGKVIAEAMSCGLPVLGYDVTAIPEIIGVNKKIGAVVPPRNIDRLHAELLTVLNNGKNYYSAACRGRVLELFDMKKNILMYEKLYSNLIET
jgi:putative colanic acid biosynthesis glycosyltransferase